MWSWLVAFCLSTGEFKRTCAASLGFSRSWKFPEISFSSLFFILGPWPRDKYSPKRTQEKWKAPSTLIYTMSIDLCVVFEPMQWAVVEGLCSYVLPGTIEILLQLNRCQQLQLICPVRVLFFPFMQQLGSFVCQQKTCQAFWDQCFRFGTQWACGYVQLIQ
jgi:hypothetical protein